MKNIYLLGFMGTGKTTTGKILASKMQMGFIDLDDMIEDREGVSIVNIFADKGQKYFRDLESRALKDISIFSNMVVGCGGGIVLRAENLKVIKDTGLPVCLDALPDVIYKRTVSSSYRPLLNVDDPKEKIKSLLSKRAPFYSKVKYHIDTSFLTAGDVADKIRGLCKKQGYQI